MPKPNYSSSGFSGEDRRVYEDGVQRKVSNKTLKELNRTHPGNILVAEAKKSDAKTQVFNQVIEHDLADAAKFSQRDPTAPAIMHGNKPSRGAMIDKELLEEDRAAMAKKGDAMPGKKY